MTAAGTKSAWVDEIRRIVTFTPAAGAQKYTAAAPVFWERILHLMRQNYRIG